LDLELLGVDLFFELFEQVDLEADGLWVGGDKGRVQIYELLLLQRDPFKDFDELLLEFARLLNNCERFNNFD